MQQTRRNTYASADSAISKYDQIIRSVAGHLQEQGFSTVKANTTGYPKPAMIKWDEKDEGVMPDIIAEHNGSIYVFELATSEHIDVAQVEDRWRLFSVYAKRYHGKFYLVIPEQKAEYLRGIIRKLTVQPEFLKLRGID